MDKVLDPVQSTHDTVDNLYRVWTSRWINSPLLEFWLFTLTYIDAGWEGRWTLKINPQKHAIILIIGLPLSIHSNTSRIRVRHDPDPLVWNLSIQFLTTPVIPIANQTLLDQLFLPIGYRADGNWYVGMIGDQKKTAGALQGLHYPLKCAHAITTSSILLKFSTWPKNPTIYFAYYKVRLRRQYSEENSLIALQYDTTF